MKAFTSIFLIFSLGYSQNMKKNFELVILDPYLKDHTMVSVLLKNNTKYNYCFVMDTTYERSEPDFNQTIHNPKVILYDLKKRKVDILSIKGRPDDLPIDSINNLKKTKEFEPWTSLAKIIYVNARKSLYLKIPFNLVRKYKNLESPGIYQVSRKKKYLGRIEYMISCDYISKYISKKKLDSLNQKGYKFFNSEIFSNKVPLLLN